MPRPPPAKRPKVTPSRRVAAKRATNEGVSTPSITDSEPTIIPREAPVANPSHQPRFDPTTLSMEEQVKRYKEWRKNGSIHNDTCWICGKGSGLVYCDTCCLAYHKTCLRPDERTHEDQDRWYCPICVSRDWHITPPSPPASPRLAPIKASSSASAATHGPSMGGSLVPPTTHAPSQAPLRPAMLVPAASPLPTSTPLLSQAQSLGPAKTQPRKGGRSRYSTLRPDVEAAISTIYGELELSRSLSGDVARLQEELGAARHEIEVLKKEISVARREAEMARFSNEAYDQLLQENEMFKRRDQEQGSLQGRIEQLTTQLDAAIETIANKDAMLDEWKKKLKGLLGEGI